MLNKIIKRIFIIVLFALFIIGSILNCGAGVGAYKADRYSNVKMKKKSSYDIDMVANDTGKQSGSIKITQQDLEKNYINQQQDVRKEFEVKKEEKKKTSYL